MRLMLDSTFLIDHLRGNPDAIDRFTSMFASGDEPLVNAVVVCEVASGLRPEHERALVGILVAIEFVQAGQQAARDAGAWRLAAQRRGVSLGLADALIAAEAHHMGAAVLTRNVRDFELTPVTVLTY